METRASELSEGNKRKLSCALTVLVIPSIELLDEPTKGLDPITRRSIYSMIKELKTES
jgi:ABC-2 type transport system ATP-binding protein